MAEHYYPGQTIPLGELTNGWTHTWNNWYIKDLPNPPGTPYSYENGYDYDRPSGQIFGAYPVIFNITGEGRWVEFWILCDYPGVAAILRKRLSIGTQQYTKPNGTLGYKDTWEQYPATAYNSWNPPSTVTREQFGDRRGGVGLRAFLQPNENYYLEIGGSYANTGGVDNDFTLEVKYSQFPTNDLRANAYEVVIASPGGQYTDTVMNAGYGATFDNTEDPIGAQSGRTGWWTYTPSTSGTVTASFAVEPVGTQGFAMQMWERNTDGTFTRLGRSPVNPSSFNAEVVADRTYFFSIGTDSANAGSTNDGQRCRLTVTGPKSKAQHVVTGTPPANDKRENAIAIKSSGGVTDQVDITWATRDTGSYGDPHGLEYDQSVWWKYTAVNSGSAELVLYNDALNPGWDDFRVQILDSSASDNLIQARASDSPITFDMVKGHVYHFGYGVKIKPPMVKYSNVKVSMTLKPPVLPTKPVVPPPNAKKPADPKKEACGTILDLIREFQKVSGYAVRIHNATTIEVYDPQTAPVPIQFDEDRGDDYYSSTEVTMAAASKVLRLDTGLMDMTGRADLETNDVGIVTSGWTLPDPLPFPQMYPTPVTRVAMTFSPHGFRASVEFMFPDAPLTMRALEVGDHYDDE